MWPSLHLLDDTEDHDDKKKAIETSLLHQKTKEMARALMGEDMDFDYDMIKLIIAKVRFSYTLFT